MTPMTKYPVILCGAGLLALTGCGGSDKTTQPGTATSSTPTTAATNAPGGPADCADVLAVGKPVLAATVKDGCLDKTQDTLIVFTSYKCKDGTTFAASDNFSGRTGAAWKKGGGTGSGPGDADAYSAAVAACTG